MGGERGPAGRSTSACVRARPEGPWGLVMIFRQHFVVGGWCLTGPEGGGKMGWDAGLGPSEGAALTWPPWDVGASGSLPKPLAVPHGSPHAVLGMLPPQGSIRPS